MSKSLFFCIICMALACAQPAVETTLPDNMAGIYTLESISYKGGEMDTSFAAENQVKIYTDKYYMYGTTRADSSAFFGFGTYAIKDSTIVEKSIYNSVALDTSSETTVKISRSPSGYTQLQKGVKMQGTAYDVGETYKMIPMGSATELDGVWEQVSFINIIGTDTTIIRNRQFKIYQGRHFMWIHRYPADSANQKFNKGYGFGTFTIKDNSISEILTASNYKEIINAPITVSYTLNGTDELFLTFNDGNSITTETYRRLN
jgi:hypothetical protein